MFLDKKELLALAIAALGVYLLLVLCLFLFQRKVIYYPNPLRQDPAIYKAEDMEAVEVVTADGLSLQGWYKASAEGKPVIVVFHGNASHMGFSAWKVRSYLDAGYGALLPAYRGYAGNPGIPTERGLYQDARAFIDWLTDEKDLEQGDIVLLGESLGSGIAIEMASTDYKSVKAVILESPYTSFVDLAKSKFSYIPLMKILLKDRYESLVKIKQVRAPLLIVHGQLDTIVPYRFGKQLYDAANEPKELATLKLAGHNDLYMHGAGQRVLHFLSGL